MIWGIIIGIPIGAAMFAFLQSWRIVRETYQWMRYGG